MQPVLNNQWGYYVQTGLLRETTGAFDWGLNSRLTGHGPLPYNESEVVNKVIRHATILSMLRTHFTYSLLNAFYGCSLGAYTSFVKWIIDYKTFRVEMRQHNSQGSLIMTTRCPHKSLYGHFKQCQPVTILNLSSE